MKKHWDCRQVTAGEMKIAIVKSCDLYIVKIYISVPYRWFNVFWSYGKYLPQSFSLSQFNYRYMKPTCSLRSHDQNYICSHGFFKNVNVTNTSSCAALYFIKETRMCWLIRWERTKSTHAQEEKTYGAQTFRSSTNSNTEDQVMSRMCRKIFKCTNINFLLIYVHDQSNQLWLFKARRSWTLVSIK